MLYLRQVIVLSVYLVICSKAADILLLSSTPSASHSRWYGKLALLLANHGHKVVLLDTQPDIVKHANITHREMEDAYRWLTVTEEQIKSDPVGLEMLSEQMSVLTGINGMADQDIVLCDAFKSQGTKDFIKEFKGKEFDLIMADTICECFYGFVHYFGYPPLVLAFPFTMTSGYIGQFDNPSYVPYISSHFNNRMFFSERAVNAFYHFYSAYIVNTYYYPNVNALTREVFGPSVPSVEEIMWNNVMLVLTGYNHVTHGAKPLPPSYVPIGGFHIDPPKPLPQDIKKFLDGAKDGAILFSMGSNFKSILMSPEKREMFLSVFKGIPQRVIWKLELDNSTEIPPNVMITKWLPQSDILGHPNVKAFVSHGGILGTQEAVHHGVPILGLPIIFDQINNMERLEKEGVAIRLYFSKLSKSYIAQQINKIINEPSFMINMKEYSAAFKDAPQTPQERALFWVEYALRNSKRGKNFLKPSSVFLTWYQRLLLDVALVIFLAVVTICQIISNIIGFIMKIISRLRNSKVSVNKKKKH